MRIEDLEKHFALCHASTPAKEAIWVVNVHEDDHDLKEGIDIPHRHTPLGVIYDRTDT